MEWMTLGHTYINVYYMILCFYKINAKLTQQQKIEYCKDLDCDETVDNKVCGARIENGLFTYKLFENECLLLKYGCQVDETKAYGIIDMKYCDELASEDGDDNNCQGRCESDIKQPVCGIRNDGEGFRINIFRNKCELRNYNCEQELKFNVTDFFICNLQTKYAPDDSYNLNKESYTRNITNSSAEDLNIELNFMETSTIVNTVPDVIETDATQINSKEIMYDIDVTTTSINNMETEELKNRRNVRNSSAEDLDIEQNFMETSTIVNTVPDFIETVTTQINSKEIMYDIDSTTTSINNIEPEELKTDVPKENNKTIFKNIVVVRGSISDIPNINTTIDNLMASTHMFDLPIREVHQNISEDARRRLVKKFGPVKIFIPFINKPANVKEDRMHAPTLSSCFHECPKKCPDIYAPVCGMPGRHILEPSIIYKNHCLMDVAQCKMFWEDKSDTSLSAAYMESSFIYCLGYEGVGLYRFLPVLRTLQHMGRIKRKGKFKYKFRNLKYFNEFLSYKQPHIMG